MTSQPTVFVVNDDPVLLRSFLGMVQEAFPAVEGFVSAEEFFAVYHSQRPGCVVLDLALPGMSGLELQQKFKELGISLPLIFVTRDATAEVADGAVHADAVNFLRKPAAGQEMCDSIRAALELDAENRRRQTLRQEVERRLARLTTAEQQVLDLVLDGKLNKEIAGELNLSVRTIEDRRARMMKKMETDSVARLVRLVLGCGESGDHERDRNYRAGSPASRNG